jgi:hypothetical protein
MGAGGMGAGEQAGRRRRSACSRRGMSLRTLAGLSGLSTGFLSMVVAAASPQQRPGLLRLTAQAYYPACTLLLKSLGDTDLAFPAVTRAVDVTAELDDPFSSALSGFFHPHVLVAAGSDRRDQVRVHLREAHALAARTGETKRPRK